MRINTQEHPKTIMAKVFQVMKWEIADDVKLQPYNNIRELLNFTIKFKGQLKSR